MKLHPHLMTYSAHIHVFFFALCEDVIADYIEILMLNTYQTIKQLTAFWSFKGLSLKMPDLNEKGKNILFLSLGFKTFQGCKM